MYASSTLPCSMRVALSRVDFDESVTATAMRNNEQKEVHARVRQKNTEPSKIYGSIPRSTKTYQPAKVARRDDARQAIHDKSTTQQSYMP